MQPHVSQDNLRILYVDTTSDATGIVSRRKLVDLQPRRVLRFWPYPMTGPDTAIPATKFISLEPLLGKISGTALLYWTSHPWGTDWTSNVGHSKGPIISDASEDLTISITRSQMVWPKRFKVKISEMASTQWTSEKHIDSHTRLETGEYLDHSQLNALATSYSHSE